jgi:hypothetical protein
MNATRGNTNADSFVKSENVKQVSEAVRNFTEGFFRKNWKNKKDKRKKNEKIRSTLAEIQFTASAFTGSTANSAAEDKAKRNMVCIWRPIRNTRHAFIA